MPRDRRGAEGAARTPSRPASGDSLAASSSVTKRLGTPSPFWSATERSKAATSSSRSSRKRYPTRCRSISAPGRSGKRSNASRLRRPMAMLSGSENCARTPPAALLVEPDASSARSSRSTSIPASARWNATLARSHRRRRRRPRRRSGTLIRRTGCAGRSRGSRAARRAGASGTGTSRARRASRRAPCTPPPQERWRARRTPYSIWNSNRPRPIPCRAANDLTRSMIASSCVATATYPPPPSMRSTRSHDTSGRRPPSRGRRSLAGSRYAPLTMRRFGRERQQPLEIGLRAVEVGLQHGADRVVTRRAQALVDASVASTNDDCSMSMRTNVPRRSARARRAARRSRRPGLRLRRGRGASA